MRCLIIWHGFTSQWWRNVLLSWALFLAKICWICKQPCKRPPEKNKKQMVAAVKLQICTPRSKLREHHLLSRMVLDPITISSNAYPVHSMVKTVKRIRITHMIVGSIDLPLAVNWSVSLKRKKGWKNKLAIKLLVFFVQSTEGNHKFISYETTIWHNGKASGYWSANNVWSIDSCYDYSEFCSTITLGH